MPKETTPSVAEQADERETEFCPQCGGSGDAVVMSDGGPDAYEVTVNCPHCHGKQTLHAAYQGVVELLDRAEIKLHEASAIIWRAGTGLGGGGDAVSQINNIADYLANGVGNNAWCVARLRGLAALAASQAASHSAPVESKACAPGAGVEPIKPYALEKLAGLGYEAGQASLTDRGPAWDKLPINDALVWMNAAEAIHAALASPAPSVGEPVLFQDKPIAWLTPDLRRVASNLAIEQARRGGSVVAGSLANYSVPAYRRATPPAAPAVTEGASLTDAELADHVEVIAAGFSMPEYPLGHRNTMRARLLEAASRLRSTAAAVPESPATGVDYEFLDGSED